MMSNWGELLKSRLQLYGHRNWVVVADSAYPAQSRPGVETIVADEEQISFLVRTFAILRECQHVKPTIYTDTELSFVSEADARGITAYREQLGRLFAGQNVRTLPHEEIISRLDRIAEKFQVFVVKTNMRIPYTSVFFELECGYWNAQSENRLRAALRSGKPRQRAAKGKRRS